MRPVCGIHHGPGWASGNDCKWAYNKPPLYLSHHCLAGTTLITRSVLVTDCGRNAMDRCLSTSVIAPTNALSDIPLYVRYFIVMLPPDCPAWHEETVHPTHPNALFSGLLPPSDSGGGGTGVKLVLGRFSTLTGRERATSRQAPMCES